MTLYMNGKRCQFGKKSFKSPWSPPSQEPDSTMSSHRPLNVSSLGLATSMPELKASGHATSGQAARGTGSGTLVKRCESGLSTSVSASRKMTRSYCVSRKTCSFVSDSDRSLRPDPRVSKSSQGQVEGQIRLTQQLEVGGARRQDGIDAHDDVEAPVKRRDGIVRDVRDGDDADRVEQVAVTLDVGERAHERERAGQVVVRREQRHKGMAPAAAHRPAKRCACPPQ